MLVLVLASAAVVLAVAGSTVLRGWARSRSADLSSLVGPGDADGYNLLLVTLDTVRADHLGCYGENDQAETPFLDSLCRNGVMFSDAVTSVPITLPSHTTIMTGLYPPNHGVRDNGTYRLAEERTTLAEDLRSHGYETAAFVGCFVLDARFGLNQGFDRYDFQVTRDGYRPGMVDFNERPASSVTDSVLSWLRERDRSSTTSPFFVWVHYFDAHLPYRSPLQALPRFSSRPYDAEITFADQQFGRLLAELKRERVLERTLIVVVADHGESLGEHGEPTHGMLLYRPTVRVPFIISCPTLFTGTHRVSDQVVGLVDIRPTVEELLGVPPGEDVDGLSLVGSGVTPDRAIYVETEMPHDLAGWSPLYAIRSHERKYIQAPRPELYDVTADPAESHDLSASDPADARAMEQRLSIVAGAMGGVGAERRLSDEERERLAALGYVQTGVAPSAGPLADPKDMMPVYNDALRAERLYQERVHAGHPCALVQRFETRSARRSRGSPAVISQALARRLLGKVTRPGAHRGQALCRGRGCTRRLRRTRPARWESSAPSWRHSGEGGSILGRGGQVRARGESGRTAGGHHGAGENLRARAQGAECPAVSYSEPLTVVS
jgi:choline-sulfatase